MKFPRLVLMAVMAMGVLALLLTGCARGAEKVAPAPVASAEAAEISSALEESDELDQLTKELEQDISFDELEKVDLG